MTAAARFPMRIAVPLTVGVLAIQSAALFAMGHPAICACGTVKLWWGVVQSSENSQHIFDWYSFSHLIHGFIYYFVAWAFPRRHNLPAVLRRQRDQFAVRHADHGRRLCAGLAAALSVVVGLAVAMELFVGFWIHDNLTLNILMLVHPIDAVRAWQAGG